MEELVENEEELSVQPVIIPGVGIGTSFVMTRPDGVKFDMCITGEDENWMRATENVNTTIGLYYLAYPGNYVSRWMWNGKYKEGSTTQKKFEWVEQEGYLLDIDVVKKIELRTRGI